MSVISDIALSRLQASTSFIKQQAQLDTQLANIVKQEEKIQLLEHEYFP